MSRCARRAVVAAILASPLVLGGCSSVRVAVTDAENGAPVAGATLVISDGAGHELGRTRTGSDGRSGLDSTINGTVLAVSAHGYAATAVAWPPLDLTRPLAVSLEPRAVADFAPSGAGAGPPEIHINKHCPCLDPVEGAPGR